MCKSDIIFLSIFLEIERKNLFEINMALKEEIDSYYS